MKKAEKTVLEGNDTFEKFKCSLSNIAQNDNYVLSIEFEGEQEEYDTNGGLEIYIKLAIEIDVTTPTHTDEIKMTYTNENKNSEKTTSTQIKFESKYGLMIYDQIFDYNENGDDVDLINDEETTIELDKEADSKELQVRTYLINNHDKEIENIVYIGKIPAESSNNTFTATLNSVKTDGENVKIYYSTNIDATENDESWTEDSTDAVAYKLVIEKMESQETIRVSTRLTIPENLGGNQQGEITQNISYLYNEAEQTRNATIELMTEYEVTVEVSSVESVGDGVTTEVSEGLDVTIYAISANEEISDGDSIYEGQTVKYYITITNNTEEDLSNVSVSTTQTNGKVWGIDVRNEYNPYYGEYVDNSYYDELDTSELDIDTIETLAIGESVTLEYEAYANYLEDCDGTTMYGTIEISTEDEEISLSIKTIENEIKEAELKLELKQASLADDWTTYSEQSILAELDITNISDSTLDNVTLQIVLSENLIYDGTMTWEDEDTDENKTVTEETETNSDNETVITLVISEIEVNETMSFCFYPETEEMDLDIDEDEVYIYSFATINENTYYSNLLTETVYQFKHDITVTQEVLVNGETLTDDTIITDGSTIIFISTITNGSDETVGVEITDYFIQGLNAESATLTTGSYTVDVTENITDDNYFDLETVIYANSYIILELTVTTNNSELTSEEITNEIIVEDESNHCTYCESVTLIMEIPEAEDEEDSNGNEDDSSGDEDTTDDNNDDDNSDGENDDSNNTDTNNNNSSDTSSSNTSNNSSSVSTYSISGTVWNDSDEDGKKDSSESGISGITIRVIDVSSGDVTDDTTTTGSDGTYSLSLEEGTYIILFIYDTSNYSITTYQASGVSDSANSDAISKNVTIDGTAQTVAATDNISLTSNTTNIDLGLIENSDANLSIAKYVSKIVVSNSTGTTTYDQDDEETLAKVEIGSKVISGSSVTIEYTIEITNSGESAGDIGTIVDYLPSALSFSSSLNSDWYQSGEYIYNSTLANEEIDAGETKEMSLILTKTMTESNTGLINNKTGLLSSDDEEIATASAEVMIGIKTGTIITYISLIIVIIIAIFGIAYLVNKKILEKRIKF